ncbi:serine/threonine protein kinase [bacterium]|nr:serine/threonine protein kinase [bacterium]
MGYLNPLVMEIGRFKVVNVLGQGNMGIVYLAEDPILDRKVAIKVLYQRITDSKELDLITREARAVARLNYQGIAQIHDIGIYQEHPYFVMEYVSGVSLSVWMRDCGICTRRDLDSRLDMLTSILQSVKFAHDNGVVHRDIKPSNIIISDSGIPKLLDFGLACLDKNHSSTNTRGNMGTPLYMAPERLMANVTVDQRADIYSLGVIAYELLAGRVPYNSKNLDELYYEILRVVPTLPGKQNSMLPMELDGIIMKMLSKKLQSRYEDLGDVISDISKLRCSFSSSVNLQSPSSASSTGYLSRSGDVASLTETVKLFNRISIYGSPSSCYFVTVNQRLVTLYRSNDFLWQKDIKDLKEVLFVSDIGDVYYRTTNGVLYKAPKSVADKSVSLSWEMSMIDNYNGEGALKRTAFNLVGDNIVSEIVAPPSACKKSLTETFFGSKHKASDMYHILCTMESDGKDTYPRELTRISLSKRGKFLWGASPDFNYLVTCSQANKNAPFDCKLYMTSKKLFSKVVGHFSIPACSIFDVQVTDAGRIFFQVEGGVKGPQLLLVREYNGRGHNLIVPRQAQILHVWEDMFCYKLEQELVVQSFDSVHIRRANTMPLDSFKVSWAVFFNHRHDMTMVMCNSQNLWFMPIDPMYMEQASNRWKRILEMKQDYDEELRTQTMRQRKAMEAEIRANVVVREQLNQSLDDIVKQKRLAEQEPAEPISNDAVREQLSHSLKVMKYKRLSGRRAVDSASAANETVSDSRETQIMPDYQSDSRETQILPEEQPDGPDTLPIPDFLTDFNNGLPFSGIN